MAEHKVLSFTDLVPGKAAALKIRTDKGGLSLINVHGPQAGCTAWAGRAAFWAGIQAYAAARSLSGRHLVIIAGDTNVYIDATTNLATEHFRSGWQACGFQRATAGGAQDMSPTLHPSRHRVDTFLVNEPLLPCLLRERAWGRGMAHHQVVGSDHLPLCLVLSGVSVLPQPCLLCGGRAETPVHMQAGCSHSQLLRPHYRQAVQEVARQLLPGDKALWVASWRSARRRMDGDFLLRAAVHRGRGTAPHNYRL